MKKVYLIFEIRIFKFLDFQNPDKIKNLLDLRNTDFQKNLTFKTRICKFIDFQNPDFQKSSLSKSELKKTHDFKILIKYFRKLFLSYSKLVSVDLKLNVRLTFRWKMSWRHVTNTRWNTWASTTWHTYNKRRHNPKTRKRTFGYSSPHNCWPKDNGDPF